MTIFKKKNNVPVLFLLLNDAALRAQEKGDNKFYYALYDMELSNADKWCKQNNAKYSIDHISDGNKIYKFTLL